MDAALIEAVKLEAKRYGINPAALLAVVEVESGGQVFCHSRRPAGTADPV